MLETPLHLDLALATTAPRRFLAFAKAIDFLLVGVVPLGTRSGMHRRRLGRARGIHRRRRHRRAQVTRRRHRHVAATPHRQLHLGRLTGCQVPQQLVDALQVFIVDPVTHEADGRQKTQLVGVTVFRLQWANPGVELL